MKRFTSLLLLMLVLVSNVPIEAKAASSLDVVINEVNWMGSEDDSAAEWIELKNNTSSEVDLTGWTILDDGETSYELSGTIAENGYFLLGNYSGADLQLTLSLANSGDSLVLKDSSGNIIDTVNSSGGEWPAGNNDSKTSMERIDSSLSGDSNWADCTSGKGTPGSLNSVSESSTGTGVELTVSDSNPASGDTITVTVVIEGVTDLFSYGMDIDYNATVLTYQSATVGSFLSESSAVATSFNAELENGAQGTVVIGEARTQETKTGVSGDGTLFTLTFLVADNPGASSDLLITNNFIANTESDIESNFTGTSVTLQATAGQVSNLVAAEGTDRYSITLTWDAPTDGADSYRILRLNSQGDYEEIGTTTETVYTDTSYIVPNVTYTYQVITILGGAEGSGVTATGAETRGLTGDSNRSDRIDGRDLENLAQHYGENYLDEDYSQLIDTTYDGNINGSDLIDIGLNWALTYE